MNFIFTSYRWTKTFLFFFILIQQVSADPFLFKENKGQWKRDVFFKADLPGGYLFLHKNALTYTFYDGSILAAKHARKNDKPALRTKVAAFPQGDVPAHGFRINFFKASTDVVVRGEHPFNNSYNYFIGNNQERWARDVKAYNEVVYENLYNGINLRYFHNGEDFKYEFIVAPGSNTKKIKMDYLGQSNISMVNGNLYIKTSVNEMIEQKPYSYQIINGIKKEVASKFVLKNNRLSFDFPEGYDKKIPLIIDPVLVFSTFSGSVSDNWGNTATYDESGSLYAGGIVFGSRFPATIGAFEVNFAGQIDIAITKYDSTGSFQEYATYLGGSFSETPQSLVVNNNNELVIFGCTSSPDFSITSNAYDATFAGGGNDSIIGGVIFPNGSDIFMAKLNPTGTNLLGSTFFGGSDQDAINELSREVLTRNYGDEFRGDVITDSAGFIYIATSTHSGDIPATPGTINTTLSGVQDGLLAKFSPDLGNLIWCSYLGGGGNDAVYNIKLNDKNELIVVGGTSSRDFPTTSGVLNEDYQEGSSDGFISIVSNDGTQVIASTYIGTSDYDQVYLLDLDAADNITVFGQTSGEYPVSVNTYSNPGSGQFIHKIGAGLKTTIFSTVIGSGSGSPDICPTALLVNECSNIYLAGWGGSVNAVDENYVGGFTFGMPITNNAYQSDTDGNDFYLMVLSANADELLYATYFGGDMGTGEHVDGGTSRFNKKGVVYHAVCSCGDSNYPVTPNAFDRVNDSRNEQGGTNTRCNNAAFKFDLAILQASFEYTPDIPCSPTSVTFKNTSRGGENFSWTINGEEVSTSDTDFNFFFQEAGDYLVQLAVIDPVTCLFEDVFNDTVSVGKQEFAVGDGGFICGGETFQLSASGASTYRWSPQTYLSNPNTANPIATPAETITYTVTMINDFGCRADSMVTISVQPEVIADFTVNIIETCDTLTKAEIINNSENVAVYAWLTGDGRIIEDENPGMITYNEPGIYQIILIGINGECSDTDTVEFEIGLVPSAFFARNVTISSDQNICLGESVQLSVSGGVAYTWSPVVGLDNPLSARPMANPTENTIYSVRVFNKNDCYFDTTVQVNVFPEVKAAFDISLDEECGKKPSLKFQNLSEGADTFLWDLGNGVQITDVTPELYTYPDTGNYIITLYATQGECTENFSRRVLVEQVVPPNAISPNNDDINEHFIIPSRREGWQLEIFNKWGEVVYESENYKGEWGAKDLPNAVYHYRLVSPFGAECKGWVKVLK
ncbi:MAG: gliding motility-associated C-terminal domain-containing protein [Bacteroidota bacterium]